MDSSQLFRRFSINRGSHLLSTLMPQILLNNGTHKGFQLWFVVPHVGSEGYITIPWDIDMPYAGVYTMAMTARAKTPEK